LTLLDILLLLKQILSNLLFHYKEYIKPVSTYTAI